MASSPSLKLLAGRNIPLLGIGTWLSPKNKAGEAVKYALENGYRHVDCAHIYGNEAEIGEYMMEVFKSGKVKREEVFVTSKLWSADMEKDDVIPACRLTLKNLQLDYLDLYLVHLPVRLEKSMGASVPEPRSGRGLLGYTPGLMRETWQEMEKLVEMGLVKAIGISNFTTRKIKDLLSFAKIKPVCNQVELNPFLPQHELKKYAEENDILLTAYSPFGNPTRPSFQPTDPVLMEDDVIKNVAAKHKCTPAQVLLKWGMQRGTPVIAKSTTPSRIIENFESINVKLDDEDMKEINGITTRFRHIPQYWTCYPNQTMDEVWDGEYLA